MNDNNKEEEDSILKKKLIFTCYELKVIWIRNPTTARRHKQ